MQAYFITPEAFIFNNKAYKTCANCLIVKSSKKAEKRSLPSDNDFESMNNRTETQLENDTEEIVFINLIKYVSNNLSNLDEGSGISFSLRVELDNNTLTNAYHDTKLLNDGSVIAIGFITSLLTKHLPVSSIHCNATYKTTKGHSVHGAGFPVAYLMLNTTNASDNAQIGLRTKALTGFLSSLCNKRLQLRHFFIDKDFAQINASKEVWPNINVQLCLWHIERQ
ncbi:27086_t:CDS:2 [Gigaspora margarita]|uniref:27086_t:CDS:1 n=1 Tax=Gigaspora margarita TaxID=4874 RepID=A0ABN7UQ23_GIGMA|nr:27086_t:CDS:2 [Gigaspora margarita]